MIFLKISFVFIYSYEYIYAFKKIIGQVHADPFHKSLEAAELISGKFNLAYWI